MEEIFQKAICALNAENFTITDSFSAEEDECCYRIFQLEDFEVTVEYAAIGASEVYSEASLSVRYNSKDILFFYRWEEEEVLHIEQDEDDESYGFIKIDEKYIPALNDAANNFARRCRSVHF